MNKYFILGVLLLFIGTACERPIYSERKVIAKDIWTYGDKVSFTVPSTDTQSLYDIELVVEHNKGFSFQNLYLQLHTIFPNGDTLKQPFSIDMSNKFGQWLGECQSDICYRASLLQPNMRFEYLGNYILVFEQFSRNDSLAGIQALELQVHPVEK